MLTDQMGRKFRYLRLSITDACNFKCVYCLPDGYNTKQTRGFLNLEEIQVTANGFAHHGIEKIRITGGEPSLRRDLVDVISICRETQGVNQVALTTNGFVLKRNIKTWIEAGVSHLNVSIDSLEPKMFHSITGHDKFDSIMRGIDLALEYGLEKVKINTVLMKQYNAHELNSFLKWVKNKPISLRFIELMQTGDNQAFFRKNHVSGESIKATLLRQGWTQTIRDKAAGPAQEFQHPDYHGNIGLIMPYSKDFCATCNRLRISAIGKLHLCLFSEAGISLRELMTHDNQDALIDELAKYIKTKKPSHSLHEGFSGATKHLAMLGG